MFSKLITRYLIAVTTFTMLFSFIGVINPDTHILDSVNRMFMIYGGILPLFFIYILLTIRILDITDGMMDREIRYRRLFYVVLMGTITIVASALIALL